MWEIDVTHDFKEWHEELNEQEQDDIAAIVNLLEEKGVDLPFPYSSGIEGSDFPHMRELRVQSHGDPIRIFYAFDPRRTGILLVGGFKTGKQKRFYKKFIKQADKLYQEHLDDLEK